MATSHSFANSNEGGDIGLLPILVGFVFFVAVVVSMIDTDMSAGLTIVFGDGSAAGGQQEVRVNQLPHM
ncbi:hypothetical protein HKCCE3408_07300 [Rhodobacterales bacterium HKCCE3408]|nr:hypothetical protein [Rhodobacterales bacterium HKCCE3408]